jgi:hypothetical protein
VKKGDRIADVDPRGRTDDLDHISDKAHRVAEGVHEALLGLVAEIAARRRGPGRQPKRASAPRASVSRGRTAGSNKGRGSKEESPGRAGRPKSGNTPTSTKGTAKT